MARLCVPEGKIERYRWCGQGVIIGMMKYECQNRDYILSWFGKKEGEAKRAYRKYVKEGIVQGRRPDLVGGGLIRSFGGWPEVLSLRSDKERVLSDERILGSRDFVERVYGEADERMKYKLFVNQRREKVEGIIKRVCRKEGVNINELRKGSRRGSISQVRSHLGFQLVEDYGLSLVEVARQLGVSIYAISQALRSALNVIQHSQRPPAPHKKDV